MRWKPFVPSCTRSSLQLTFIKFPMLFGICFHDSNELAAQLKSLFAYDMPVLSLI